MKIVMRKPGRGAYDGMHVMEYREGEEHVVGTAYMPFELAEIFLSQGLAEQVVEETRRAPGPTEIKSEPGSDAGSGEVPAQEQAVAPVEDAPVQEGDGEQPSDSKSKKSSK